jgi:hypothetical protein
MPEFNERDKLIADILKDAWQAASGTAPAAHAVVSDSPDYVNRAVPTPAGFLQAVCRMWPWAWWYLGACDLQPLVMGIDKETRRARTHPP